MNFEAAGQVRDPHLGLAAQQTQDLERPVEGLQLVAQCKTGAHGTTSVAVPEESDKSPGPSNRLKASKNHEEQEGDTDTGCDPLPRAHALRRAPRIAQLLVAVGGLLYE